MSKETNFTLLELMELKNGVNLSRGTVTVLDSLIYTNENLEKDLVCSNNVISKESLDLDPWSLKAGNIVINLVTGRSSVVSEKNVGKTIKNVFACCKILDPVYLLDPWFFCYYINESKTFKDAQKAGLIGGGVRPLSIKDLQVLQIKLPTIETQKKIGNFYKKLCRYNFLSNEKQELITSLLINQINKVLREG